MVQRPRKFAAMLVIPVDSEFVLGWSFSCSDTRPGPGSEPNVLQKIKSGGSGRIPGGRAGLQSVYNHLNPLNLPEIGADLRKKSFE
jgi:hypothetical protein